MPFIGTGKLMSLALSFLLLTTATPASPEVTADVSDEVLTYFNELAAIPRPSGHEQAVGKYLVSWAKEQGFEATKDKLGNVIFDVPATAGCESKPLTVLQGHMDMVAVSDDAGFDPETDPITTVRSGDLLTAKGTSLGADDGAGLAVIMTYVASDCAHGPLRVIVTVNEENGLTGVKGLNPKCVEDAKYLINLDNETEGSICVSTAGNTVLDVSGKAETVKPKLDSALSVKLHGLAGGHSGICINSGRINAVVSLAEMLLSLEENGIEYELSAFTGGSVNNAIPNEAEALIVVDAEDKETASELFGDLAEELGSVYATSDKDVQVDVKTVQTPAKVFTEALRADIVDFACLVPNGVNTMSQRVSGLVESSSNLGAVKADGEGVSFSICVRSSQQPLMDSLLLRQQRLAELCGFTSEIACGSDAWPVDPDAELPKLIAEIYLEQTGNEAVVESVHAGLECGTFARMNEEIDMVCIGAQIDGAHTTSETLHISSVNTLYELLSETLARLK